MYGVYGVNFVWMVCGGDEGDMGMVCGDEGGMGMMGGKRSGVRR